LTWAFSFAEGAQRRFGAEVFGPGAGAERAYVERDLASCPRPERATTMGTRTRSSIVCEYCGCQSLRAIADLTDEHTAALDLIDRARRAAAVGAGGGAAAAAELLALLEPHTAVEEEALFPAMAREHAEHVAVLHAEHARIHAALRDVAAGAQGPESSQELAVALQMLREHIFKEQDGLFPAALIELDPRDWDRLAAVRSRVGTALPPARAG
jgi:hypothetical protein